MTDLFRVTCITPVHVGCGRQLLRGLDYYSEGETTYVLDPERLIAAGADVAGFAEAITRYRRTPIGEILRARRIDVRRLCLRTISGAITASKLHLAVRTGDGRPMLPGSSLKGALRTLLLASWIGNGGPHRARSKIGEEAIQEAVKNRKSRYLDQLIFRSRGLRDPQGDVLRFLSASDTVFAPERIGVVSSVALGTRRNTLTAVEALEKGARGVVRLSIDQSSLYDADGVGSCNDTSGAKIKGARGATN